MSTVNVSVANANQAPVISGVAAIIYSGYVWVVGTVADADDDPAGTTVTIDGDASGTATVHSNGSFSYVQLYPHSYGTASASTKDVHGASSNVVYFEFTE